MSRKWLMFAILFGLTLVGCEKSKPAQDLNIEQEEQFNEKLEKARKGEAGQKRE